MSTFRSNPNSFHLKGALRSEAAAPLAGLLLGLYQ